MPGGPDELPWLGEYPFANTADSQGGIHMIGLAADRPDPSLGTQTGSDGAVAAASTAFTAASGRFVSANTGDTIQIIDTGASPPVVYSFTVTFVSGTALTLSSGWAGTGTSDLSWSLQGQGPSNAGLSYLSSDASEFAVSDGTAWHSGSGWRFNVDNEGGSGYVQFNDCVDLDTMPDPLGIGGMWGAAFEDASGCGLALGSTTALLFKSEGALLFQAGSPANFDVGIATAPDVSSASTLALGSAYQNTLGYDVVLSVYLSVTANVSGVLQLGVGPTNTPTQQTIVTGSTATGIWTVPIYLPAGYYALLSTTGTITLTVDGQIATPV